MIATIAELVQAVIDREVESLAAVDIKHGPTIGSMYEGLTQSVLARALPPGINVRQGFIRGSDGRLSDEVDCIVAKGDGEPIPYTTRYIHDVREVIAAIQVKKTLDKATLVEGYQNLRSVAGLPLSGGVPKEARGTFESISRTSWPENVGSLPSYLEYLWHFLVSEAALPARILLGYHGYKTPAGLRGALASHLETLVGLPGWGPRSLPSLVVSPAVVLAKGDGLPWWAPMKKRWWPLLMEVPGKSPARAMLEVIWSRIVARSLVGARFEEDDVLTEAFEFIAARFVDPPKAWEYRATVTKARGRPAPSPQAWRPEMLSDVEHVAIVYLCGHEEIDFGNPPAGAPSNIHEILKGLRTKGLVGPDMTRPTVYRLITAECSTAIDPEFGFVAGENVDGRLTRWLLRRAVERGTQGGAP